MNSKRKADPDPFSILLLVLAGLGPTISAIDYWKTHHKRALYKTRSKLAERLDELSAELRYLRIDIEDVENLFKGSRLMDGPTVRLGNGALLTPQEFQRYRKIADRIYDRVKRVHQLATKIHGLAFEMPHIDQLTQTNVTGEALARARALIASQNYSIEKAFSELRALADMLELMIKQLNDSLGRS